MTTHRRPLAVVGETLALGRGTDAHYQTLYAGSPIVYRRLRVGGSGMFGDRVREMMTSMKGALRGSMVVSPRSAVIAMVAVVVLLMGAMGTGLAQQRYTVQEGDTIASIADTFGVDPEGIRRSSYLPTGENLRAGQVLVIPNPGQSPSDAALMAAEREGTSPWVSTAHWVESGDTLAGIAALYGHDPVTLADFNGIDDPTEINVGQRILIPPVRDGAEAVAEERTSSGVFVSNVGTHQQTRNLSCEYAAAYIATAAFGDGVEEWVFIENVPNTLNPHWGYRGNIDGWWGGTDDYGVYPEPLVPVLNAHGYAGEVMYTEGDASQLTAHIDAGHPVLVWLGFWGDTRERLNDDGSYSVAAGMHVVTVYGYDDGGVYVSDPATGAYDYYGWGEFTEMWTVLDGMSMAVYPL